MSCECHQEESISSNVQLTIKILGAEKTVLDTLEEVHCRQKGHIGIKKTIHEINPLSALFMLGDL